MRVPPEFLQIRHQAVAVLLASGDMAEGLEETSVLHIPGSGNMTRR